MQGVCVDCGHDGKLHAHERCQPCYWRAKHDAAKEICRGCGRRERLRPIASGLRCWRCVRREAPRKQPTPRRCVRCGHVRRHAAHGLCSACYQRDPLTVDVWVHGAEIDSVSKARHGSACSPAGCLSGAPRRHRRHLRRVERALHAGVERPAALIAAVSDGGGPAAARETPPAARGVPRRRRPGARQRRAGSPR